MRNWAASSVDEQVAFAQGPDCRENDSPSLQGRAPTLILKASGGPAMQATLMRSTAGRHKRARDPKRRPPQTLAGFRLADAAGPDFAIPCGSGAPDGRVGSARDCGTRLRRINKSLWRRFSSKSGVREPESVQTSGRPPRFGLRARCSAPHPPRRPREGLLRSWHPARTRLPPSPFILCCLFCRRSSAKSDFETPRQHC